MIRFVVLLLLLAAVLYGVFWAIDRRNSGGSGGSPARPKPRGPVGPDDDEAFLRNLDWEQRRKRGGSAGSPPADPPTHPKDTNPKDGLGPNPPQPDAPGA